MNRIASAGVIAGARVGQFATRGLIAGMSMATQMALQFAGQGIRSFAAGMDRAMGYTNGNGFYSLLASPATGLVQGLNQGQRSLSQAAQKGTDRATTAFIRSTVNRTQSQQPTAQTPAPPNPDRTR
ncbi:hypothetical protein SAMN05444392_10849 [Seinonella peptonophila]|uniref:Uncharacterized protein n=1 Tax=Seinonella peptonophila TaxID=112248 RepID=A0A1M4Z5K8_9BACL|nr:hypothetical protein [Seinonella peptonophila]SHF13238.1 hypothetical protein SAMN05444392_10849 [Seinonella peptonophila]